MSQQHVSLITEFYTCFQRLDGDGMAACYHPEISFSDPVFPALKATQAGAMWKMLCGQAKEFKLTFHSVSADENKGRAFWEAKYLFSKTGRPVHNKITASFEFQDGKIIRHVDEFNLWKWTQMALGPMGYILGWSPLIQNKVRAMAANNLDNYIKSSQ